MCKSWRLLLIHCFQHPSSFSSYGQSELHSISKWASVPASSLSSRLLYGVPLIIPQGVQKAFSSTSSISFSGGEDICQHANTAHIINGGFQKSVIISFYYYASYPHQISACSPQLGYKVALTIAEIQSFQSMLEVLTPTCWCTKASLSDPTRSPGTEHRNRTKPHTNHPNPLIAHIRRIGTSSMSLWILFLWSTLDKILTQYSAY